VLGLSLTVLDCPRRFWVNLRFKSLIISDCINWRYWIRVFAGANLFLLAKCWVLLSFCLILCQILFKPPPSLQVFWLFFDFRCWSCFYLSYESYLLPKYKLSILTISYQVPLFEWPLRWFYRRLCLAKTTKSKGLGWRF